MERQSHEIGRQEAKQIAEIWLDGKYSQYTVYDMVVGKARMQTVVRQAIDAYKNVRDVADLTHETLLKEAAERYRKNHNIEMLEEHDAIQADADDECFSQVNPEADAHDGRDLTEREKFFNRRAALV